MSEFLIDVNLPRRLKNWIGDSFQFVFDIDDEMSDSDIWDYAKENDLTIVRKDSDFSHRIILSEPPPKIIHIRVGNMRLRAFTRFIETNWDSICAASREHKLVNVYVDRIETIS